MDLYFRGEVSLGEVIPVIDTQKENILSALSDLVSFRVRSESILKIPTQAICILIDGRFKMAKYRHCIRIEIIAIKGERQLSLHIFAIFFFLD